jgi:hypothetical protein
LHSKWNVRYDRYFNLIYIFTPTARDFASRGAFREQLATLVDLHPDVIRHFIMELTINVVLCEQPNMTCWSEANPNELHVKPLHTLGY